MWNRKVKKKVRRIDHLSGSMLFFGSVDDPSIWADTTNPAEKGCATLSYQFSGNATRAKEMEEYDKDRECDMCESKDSLSRALVKNFNRTPKVKTSRSLEAEEQFMLMQQRHKLQKDTQLEALG